MAHRTHTHTQRLLVLYGLSGSGKSTFAQSFIEQQPTDTWIRVSQDVLGTRQACIQQADEALADGQSVIIDRTNLTPKQRAHWVELATKYHVNPEVVVMMTPLQVCIHRACSRTYHEGDVAGKDAKSIVLRYNVNVQVRGIIILLLLKLYLSE
eukprot:m.165806 g.165806  ORF g.165806 m.165806 type:complete len:153 (-) comp14435_c0_seq2:412-870(-)